MVSVLDSGLRGPGSSPGWGHCVVFFSKTLFSHSASLHPGEIFMIFYRRHRGCFEGCLAMQLTINKLLSEY